MRFAAQEIKADHVLLTVAIPVGGGEPHAEEIIGLFTPDDWCEVGSLGTGKGGALGAYVLAVGYVPGPEE
jgi:hypothetical protein